MNHLKVVLSKVIVLARLIHTTTRLN
ncbi:unnamed protein product, partial [Vitis vinifera]|uniref:Uncharacterized protein n=1 Tax=Vitis vinifera TaxID=29760 RepID=D7SNS2_VITVI